MNAPLIAIARHRLSTDGAGVTTLVCFHGCPLRCRYCLNRKCLEPDGVWRTVTPDELLSETMADNLYFLATGGGVCFGGGEPLLRAGFIRAFCEQKPAAWHVYVETSLNVPLTSLKETVPYVDRLFVDVKDMNPAIYTLYTGGDNHQVIANLQWLAQEGLQQRVTVRLPLIPGFNAAAGRQQSRLTLEAMGFHDFDLFEYIIR